ncbi:hypothetical protein [Azospirillum argentinense]
MADAMSVWAVINRKAPGAYRLVVRWLLGQEDPALPHPGDTFDVTIGVFGQPAVQLRTATVQPSNFAMLDPPREMLNQPDASDRKWRIITKPPGQPISPSCPADPDTPPPDGFGVYHLLNECTPPTLRWRLASMLAEQLKPIVKARAPALRGFSALEALAKAQGTSLVDMVARALSAILVDDVPRYWQPREVVARQMGGLIERTISGKGRTATRWEEKLFQPPAGGVQEEWEYAALVSAALTTEALVSEVLRIREQRENARHHLRLRAMVGGTMIDYWCSPGSSASACADNDRGRLYPGAELVALGVTFDDVTEAELRSWIAGGRPLSVTVKHTPASGKQTGPTQPLQGADEVGEDWEGLRTVRFVEPLNCISVSELTRALQDGSSKPPPPPKGARINYDLVQSNTVKAKSATTTDSLQAEEQPQHTWSTGDGRLAIHITAPDFPDAVNPCTGQPPLKGQPDKDKTVFGYNVYGMWKTKGTEQFIVDPTQNPTLAELRPWLITRRYSYRRDLEHAFPRPSSGGMPEGVARVLKEPPWLPVAEQANTLWDRTPRDQNARAMPASTAERLPDAAERAAAIFIHDLRAGMDSGMSGSKRQFISWDPEDPVKRHWVPEMSRDGEDLTAPQAYRFWVTSVDAFEQESPPVPVMAEDVDAGEAPSPIFLVRRRQPMTPPPLPTPPGIDRDLVVGGQGISLDRRSLLLTIHWETPYLENVGYQPTQTDGGSGNKRRIPHAGLEWQVIVFRRVLRRMVKPPTASSKWMEDDTVPPDFPHWLGVVDRLKRENWEPWKKEWALAGKGGGPAWSHEVPLTKADRGYEYMALIGARIRDKQAVFWARTVLPGVNGMTGRQLRRLDDSDTHFVAETPRASDPAATATAPLANPERPRKIEAFDETEFVAAGPVLPPPGVRRDLVLMNLLGCSFVKSPTDPTPSEPTNWGGTGIRLTPGQKAVLRSSLARVKWRDVENDPRLAAARWLLASEFGMPEVDEPLPVLSAISRLPLGQSQSIGFRGLMRLAWTYVPHRTKPLKDDEAEAMRFLVYSVRVPVAPEDEEAAKAYASITIADAETAGFVAAASEGRGRGRATAGTATRKRLVRFNVSIPKTEEGALDTIDKFGKPGLVRVDPTGSSVPVFGTVAGFQRVREDATSIKGVLLVLLPAEPSSKKCGIRVYIGQPVWEVAAEHLIERPHQHVLFLPIGGGRREVMAWWVSPISAQGIEAGHDGRAQHVEGFPETIEPAPPMLVRAEPPVFTDHVLDPRTHSLWMPTMKPGEEAIAPRLVLTWKPPATGSTAGIAVERDFVIVEDPELTPFAYEQRTAWQAIRDIETVQEGQALFESDIALLETAEPPAKDGWLLGGTVTIPEDQASRTITNIGVHVARAPRGGRHLPAGQGVKNLEVLNEQGGREMRPGLVDYYRDHYYQENGTERPQPREVMRTDRLYRYRLASYIDLHELGARNLPEQWRYLPSLPTPWTSYQRPSTPPVTIQYGKAQDKDVAGQVVPSVEIIITTDRSKAPSLFPTLSDDEWFFRVVVRRKAAFVLKGDNLPAEDWMDIDRPLELGLDRTEALRDFALERDDIGVPLTLNYRVDVRQIRVLPRRGRSEEQVLRVVTVDLPPTIIRSPRRLDNEIHVSIPVTIALGAETRGTKRARRRTR